MKKILFLVVVLICFHSHVFSQTTRQLRKQVELKMPMGSGENGGTVAVSLKTRNLYATVVGNKTYAMAFFNGVGQLVSPPDLSLLADIRGLWYNPVLKTFQANTFGTGGWVNYVLDDAGIPYDVKPLFSGQLQPAVNSIAAYNQRENVVYFLKGSVVVSYDVSTGKQVVEKTYPLKTGYTKKVLPPVKYKIDSTQTLSKYNSTTIIYTGVTNAEFGLLNIETKEIELYSKQDGLLYQKLKLPPEALVKDKFNFAFANNIYFLYEKGKRTWVGYR